MGKSTLPEFGLTATTETLSHSGRVQSLEPSTTSTGGSSGGRCGTVAAGVVPIAHANDGGGSIRDSRLMLRPCFKPSRDDPSPGPNLEKLLFR